MIAIGSDHAGFKLKEHIKDLLNSKGIEFKDFGCFDENSVDYPDISEAVSNAVAAGECEKGILICGTGIGMSIVANKVNGVRAALCSDTFSARFTRLHNDANVLCMGARVLGEGLAADIAEIFLDTPFEGGRHERRVNMISEVEKRN